MKSPGLLGLLWTHVVAQVKIFIRTPVAAFFTIALPLLMLVLFVALFGNDTNDTAFGPIKTAQFYSPGLAVFAAASATYTNIGINLSISRDEGILKRLRGTPLPPWLYLTAVVVGGVVVALVATAIMVGVGVAAYGVNIELAKVPAMLLAFLVGAFTFASLGVALAAVSRSASSAPAIANATILPLGFISGIFISLGQDSPQWLDTLGNVFPLKHFAVAFTEAMSPFSKAPAIEWGHIAVMLVWAAVAVGIARWKFAWEPAVGASSTRGRRRSSSASSAAG